jgi:hypothetical protein
MLPHKYCTVKLRDIFLDSVQIYIGPAKIPVTTVYFRGLYICAFYQIQVHIQTGRKLASFYFKYQQKKVTIMNTWKCFSMDPSVVVSRN